MYFQDAPALQSHLNNDWTVFLKNLKHREDSHLELLQYNKKLITKQRSEDDQLFVNDQIIQHQHYFGRINLLNQQMEEQEKEIIQKYEGNIISFPQIIKLMGRVGARILEIYQSSIDKCKSFDDELIDKHNRMKNALIKLINQKDKMNLEEVTKIVIEYARVKLFNEMEKLKRLIKGLENGEYERLQQIYVPRQKKLSLVIERKAEKSVDKAKVSSVGREEKSPIREEIRKLQIIRKQKQKLASKMMNGLYSMLDLSRQQFMQDMCISGKQKATRLYNEIFSRNKFNHDQIIAFEAKKDIFHQKVRIFKQMMEQASKKIAQLLMRKPIKEKHQDLSNSAVQKSGLGQNQEKSEELQLTEKKNVSARYRISSPKSKRDRDISNFFSSSQHSTQENFNHFKFDTSNNSPYPRTNRNKLPFIANYSSHRRSSFDPKVELNRSSHVNSTHRQKIQEKDESEQINNVEEFIRNEKPKDTRLREQKLYIQRAKVPLKNIEVGVDGVLRKQESVLHHVHKEKKRVVQPNPMEYTFYVRKSGNKFYEPKHNIIF